MSVLARLKVILDESGVEPPDEVAGSEKLGEHFVNTLLAGINPDANQMLRLLGNCHKLRKLSKAILNDPATKAELELDQPVQLLIQQISLPLKENEVQVGAEKPIDNLEEVGKAVSEWYEFQGLKPKSTEPLFQRLLNLLNHFDEADMADLIQFSVNKHRGDETEHKMSELHGGVRLALAGQAVQAGGARKRSVDKDALVDRIRSLYQKPGFKDAVDGDAEVASFFRILVKPGSQLLSKDKKFLLNAVTDYSKKIPLTSSPKRSRSKMGFFQEELRVEQERRRKVGFALNPKFKGKRRGGS